MKPDYYFPPPWPEKSGRKALITGITGQDGSYLAELLLAKGYEVCGMIRRSSSFNTERIDHLYQDPHEPDVRLRLRLRRPERRLLAQPDPQDRPAGRDLQPRRPVARQGLLRHPRVHRRGHRRSAPSALLEAIRELGPRGPLLPGVLLRAVRQGRSRRRRPRPRRSTRAAPTPRPRPTPSTSPATTARRTACSRATASCSTTSRPRRGETFVTRKITRAVARIKLGLQDKLYLGNLDAKRDWGFAGDYVEAMWLMLQADQPDDYVDRHRRDPLGARVLRRWRSPALGLPLDLGRGGRRREGHRPRRPHPGRGRPTLLPPAEVDLLLGDAGKAKRELGWTPTVTFDAGRNDDRRRPEGD